MKGFIRSFSIGILFLTSCKAPIPENHEEKPTESNRTMEKRLKSPDDKSMTGHIVEKPFVNKVNQPTGVMELYFRASIQDYFIKFCESELTREELEPFIDKAVTVNADVVDGEWDNCDGIDMQQSRMGRYMIIKKLL